MDKQLVLITSSIKAFTVIFRGIVAIAPFAFAAVSAVAALLDGT